MLFMDLDLWCSLTGVVSPCSFGSPPPRRVQARAMHHIVRDYIAATIDAPGKAPMPWKDQSESEFPDRLEWAERC